MLYDNHIIISFKSWLNSSLFRGYSMDMVARRVQRCHQQFQIALPWTMSVNKDVIRLL